MKSVGVRLTELPIDDEMLLEVTRPVRGGPTGATASTKLQRPLEMFEFDTKLRECGERVDNESAAVAGVVITLVGIWSRLDGTVKTDRMGDPHVLLPGMRLASLGIGRAL